MEHELIFGAAYYEEYLPCDRLEEDMRMMAEAGLNTIRIAESTWSTEEPRPGEYDFSRVDRVIDAAARHGLKVIVGTPTYAVPPWLAALDPEVLAVTAKGPGRYGPRQNMDITNPSYLRYAEGVIRALVSHTAPRENVIGFQIDNETKHYGTAGPRVLARFRRWMAERYGTVERLNDALGLRYWSNSVSSFEELPDPTGAVNASYYLEFARFQRELAAEFLRWQSEIVKEYLRPGQFITQNFDYEWRPDPATGLGFSSGVQPDIDHYEAAKALTLVGTDIYFFAQDRFTGLEAAFGGDLMRPLRRDNYLVLESHAQGFKEWLPYPGQLRQMCYSHIASGARGVMYWNWHSLHNGPESYWKGLLSHDFAENPTYREAASVGAELKRLAPALAGLKKANRAAILVDTGCVTALRAFPTARGFDYNDAVLGLYRALYSLNIECDVIFSQEADWSAYRLLVVPSLYCASEELIARVRAFVAEGGTVFASFRSFFADETCKIYHDSQPHGLTEVFGLTYNQYTAPVDVTVDGAEARYWMELLRPDTAEVMAPYRHRYWGEYAAVTRNRFGKGRAWYLGTWLPDGALRDWLSQAAEDAGLAPDIPLRWPLAVRSGVNAAGKTLRFLMNYSSSPQTLTLPWGGTELRSGAALEQGRRVTLPDWGVYIIEEAAT